MPLTAGSACIWGCDAAADASCTHDDADAHGWRGLVSAINFESLLCKRRVDWFGLTQCMPGAFYYAVQVKVEPVCAAGGRHDASKAGDGGQLLSLLSRSLRSAIPRHNLSAHWAAAKMEGALALLPSITRPLLLAQNAPAQKCRMCTRTATD